MKSYNWKPSWYIEDAAVAVGDDPNTTPPDDSAIFEVPGTYHPSPTALVLSATGDAAAEVEFGIWIRTDRDNAAPWTLWRSEVTAVVGKPVEVRLPPYAIVHPQITAVNGTVTSVTGGWTPA